MPGGGEVGAAQVRALALALPGVVERDHHGLPSFRVRGRILATLPGPQQLRVMVPEPEIRALAAERPDCCRELRWGGRLACLVVDLRRAEPQLVQELLSDAWAARAPRSSPPEPTGGPPSG